jgi:hypothetical protein
MVKGNLLANEKELFWYGVCSIRFIMLGGVRGGEVKVSLKKRKNIKSL